MCFLVPPIELILWIRFPTIGRLGTERELCVFVGGMTVARHDENEGVVCARRSKFAAVWLLLEVVFRVVFSVKQCERGIERQHAQCFEMRDAIQTDFIFLYISIVLLLTSMMCMSPLSFQPR